MIFLTQKTCFFNEKQLFLKTAVFIKRYFLNNRLKKWSFSFFFVVFITKRSFFKNVETIHPYLCAVNVVEKEGKSREFVTLKSNILKL